MLGLMGSDETWVLLECYFLFIREVSSTWISPFFYFLFFFLLFLHLSNLYYYFIYVYVFFLTQTLHRSTGSRWDERVSKTRRKWTGHLVTCFSITTSSCFPLDFPSPDSALVFMDREWECNLWHSTYDT